MKAKELRRQFDRTVGGQDLWPRKSVAHTLRNAGFLHYRPEWAREYIQRRLGGALATPVGKLP